MNREQTRKHIEGHEGRRHAVYLDTVGVMTVGVGMNLEETSARQRIEALKVNYEDLCAQRAELTDEHINLLLEEDISNAIITVSRVVPSFWDHPDEVQMALVDMTFNMGSPRVAKFVNMIAALNRKDYLAAADAMADSLWAKQVPNRAAADIALVRSAA
jgi:lysozyme